MSQKHGIAGIVLAAGSSVRMGGIKQLLPYKGSPLLQHVLDLVRCINFSQRVLVLGHEASEIRRRCRVKDFIIRYNPHFEKGQSTSIRSGIQVLDSDIDGAIFFLGDQPLVSKHTIRALIQAYEQTQAPIVVPVYNAQRGNPVFFHSCLFAEVQSVSGDTGPRVLLTKYTHCLTRVEVEDPGIVQDVDTWEDYCRLPK
ncbi:MAG: nucleotidyltransferase family protein [Desulfovermiculus sp.]